MSDVSVSTLVSMSVNNFKKVVGAEKIDILVSPKTQKLFAAGDNGKNYKVEAAIDFTKPIAVLIDGGDFDNACFINERSMAEVKISL